MEITKGIQTYILKPRMDVMLDAVAFNGINKLQAQRVPRFVLAWTREQEDGFVVDCDAGTRPPGIC